MTLLDEASSQFEAGRYRDAIATLWTVEANLRGSDDSAGALRMLEIVSELHEVTKGGQRKQCEELAQQANKIGYRAEALAVIPEGVLVGGGGLPVQRPQEGRWDLIFKTDHVFVHQTIDAADAQTLTLGWHGLSVDVAVAKRKRTTQIYFGLPIIAVPATLLGVTYGLGTDKYTLVHLATPAGDMVLNVGQIPIQSVRRTLAPVFEKIAQVAAAYVPTPTPQAMIDTAVPGQAVRLFR